MTSAGTPPDDPGQSAPAEPQPVAQSGAGSLSPDGRWLWDGARWVPAPPPPPPAPPPGYPPPAPESPPPGYPPPPAYPPPQ